jgi:hypothetical protein
MKAKELLLIHWFESLMEKSMLGLGNMVILILVESAHCPWLLSMRRVMV